MSSKPELPSARAVRAIIAQRDGMADLNERDGDVLANMLRAQYAALKEPWCSSCHGVGKYVRVKERGILPQPCPSCNGTGLNPYARSVIEVGEAAGLSEEKEEG